MESSRSFAENHMQKMAMNEEKPALYELRQKHLHDAASLREDGQQEGVSIGMQKGRPEGERGMFSSLLKSLFKNQLPVEQIASICDMSVEQVKQHA